MPSLSSIVTWLDQQFPPVLAESWDNVGLLVGDPLAGVTRLMTCLTVTGETVEEAIAQRTELIVTHHPLPFRPLGRLTTETPEGSYLLRLIGAGIGIYSPHTAFDSAEQGINQRLANGLGLQQIVPLLPSQQGSAGTGTGRFGAVPNGTTLKELAVRAGQFLEVKPLQIVGNAEREVRRVAIACGSAGELLAAARAANCDCFVTGEARFHTCLEAQATGMSLILAGHFASERFAVEAMADMLAASFPDVTVWASRDERDPITWV